MIQVDVTDNGPGVPPEVMDRIFSPFFTTKPQGSGLGLAIVRKIVDAHDGRIDVGGAAGRRHARSASRCRSAAATSCSGTQFASAVGLGRAVEHRPESGEDAMGRILVADDHDSLRRGIVRALSDAHHEVDEAPNGNVAIEKLHEGQYDVVLSDLKMGGSDGMDVLRTAKALHPTTRRHPDDRVRIGPHGGRGDEDRRLRLRAEAVRDRGDGAQDREGHRAPPPASTRSSTCGTRSRTSTTSTASSARAARCSRCSAIVKKVAKSNTTVPDSRRNGHRQGADRRRDPPQLAARGAQLRQGELRGAAGEPARIGAVRTREGGVHRRRQAARRPLRAGRRRHAVPRRSRRHERQHAGQDPARPAGARVRAPRRHADAARRRPASSRRPTATCRRWSPTASSARTSTTASTSSRSRCRRCASARTTSRSWRRSSCAASPAS